MRILIAVIILLGVACSTATPVTGSVAAAHGAADLRCSYERTSAYKSERGTWIAQGCGGWAEYSCTRPYSTSGGWLLTSSTPAGGAMCDRIAVHSKASGD